MLRISLSQWHAFVATNEQGNFRKAAETLNKTQSAIAHSVRKMEDTLGHRLFVIQEREARITQVGKLLLPYARTVLEDAQRAESVCKLTCIECEEGAGTLPIAVTPAFPTRILLQVLDEVSRLYPDLSFELHDTSVSAAATLLSDGKARIAIDIASPRSIMTETLGSVPFVYVAAPTHELSEKYAITTAERKQHKQIVVDGFCDQRGNPVRRSEWMTTQFWRAKELLLEGHGYAWLRRHLVEAEIAADKLSTLSVEDASAATVPLGLGYRESAETCDVVLTFVAILRDALAPPYLDDEIQNIPIKTGT